MRKDLVLALAAATALAGCNNSAEQQNGTNTVAAEAPQAEPNSGATIADGLKQAGNARFLAAVNAAGLSKTLAAPGEYTVLVPMDAAFAKLPSGELDRLMKPEGREQLTGILSYHVLPGTILVTDLDKAIVNGKGKAVLATMQGDTVTVTREGDRLLVTDSKGGKATLAGNEQRFKNGVVHQIDTVIIPG